MTMSFFYGVTYITGYRFIRSTCCQPLQQCITYTYLHKQKKWKVFTATRISCIAWFFIVCIICEFKYTGKVYALRTRTVLHVFRCVIDTVIYFFGKVYTSITGCPGIDNVTNNVMQYTRIIKLTFWSAFVYGICILRTTVCVGKIHTACLSLSVKIILYCKCVHT